MPWTTLLLLILGGPTDPPTPTGIRFTDVSEDAGLRKPLAGLLGHGAAWGDYDGDGRIDLYVGGFCDRPDAEYAPSAGPIPNHLFRNLGNGKFSDATPPQLRFHGRTSGAVFADLDNDGRLDLYAANNAKPRTRLERDPQRTAQTLPSKLFHNLPGGFVDVSVGGACPKELLTARNIGVFDFDGDGLLDLYVVEDTFRPAPSRSALFRNLGNMKFEDVTRAVGLPEDVFGLGLAVADLNEDGRPDFFVAHSNRLFLSTGNAKYREAKELAEVFAYKPMDREDWACGAAFGDLDGDGRLDLVVTHHHEPARLRYFCNLGVKEGVPQFKEAFPEGFRGTVPVRCPHVEIQDFDNDGRPDVFVSAAWLDGDGMVTPLVFRNEGSRDGTPVLTPPRPIRAPMVYYPAGPSGDYDGDGRLDLFLINWFAGNHSRLLHNESAKRHWLQVAVKGKKMNRMGIGAKVLLYRAGRLGELDGLLGVQEVTTGYGYASGQPALCHFGLGDLESVDVRVILPGGKKLDQKAVAADRFLQVEEP